MPLGRSRGGRSSRLTAYLSRVGVGPAEVVSEARGRSGAAEDHGDSSWRHTRVSLSTGSAVRAMSANSKHKWARASGEDLTFCCRRFACGLLTLPVRLLVNRSSNQRSSGYAHGPHLRLVRDGHACQRSLTRKRSLVQIQYRPPVTPLISQPLRHLRNIWRLDRLTCRSNFWPIARRPIAWRRHLRARRWRAPARDKAAVVYGRLLFTFQDSVGQRLVHG